MPAYHAEPPVRQIWVSPSLVNWSWRTPHEVIGTDWEREGSVAGLEWTMGIGVLLDVTCVFKGYLSPISYILVSTGLWSATVCTCPILWLGVTDYTQFMTGNSGHMLTWWSMVKCSVSTSLGIRPKPASQKESSYLQRMTVLCSKTLNTCAIICL